MKITRGISSAAVLLLLLGTSAPLYSQGGRQRERQERREDQSKRKNQVEVQRRAQAENQRARQQQEQRQRSEQVARDRQQQDRERQQRQQAQAEQRMQQQQERAQQDRARRQQQELAQRREQERIQQERGRQQQLEAQRREQERGQQERLRLDQQREQERRRQQDRELQARLQPLPGRPSGWDQGRKEGWGGADVPPGQRLSDRRQRELIDQNRRQQEQFRQRFDNDLRRGEEQGHFLQKLHRLQQYRYQQEYLERQRQHRARLWSYRDHDYHRDPHFYTVANYRYLRGGRYYVTSVYGVNLIQDALNYGYAEGFRAGRADRMDGWRFDYRNSLAYRDASFGYYGLYVGPSDYNYYFREGFRRGYEDGYYGRYRYGRYDNGSYFILDSVRSGIFIAVRF